MTNPLILCGPILRRAKANAVTVWVALREPRRVTLRVYEVNEAYNGNGSAGSGRPSPRLSGFLDTRQFGANLHVACVTAVAESGLEADKLYCYDLEIGPHGQPAGSQYENNLSAHDLLTTSGSGSATKLALGYQDGLLPRFALPPTDLCHLRIFHGSCRKPHAEGPDALVALDALLSEAMGWSLAIQAVDRPHQLFLTGDQIYADDVAAALLHELTRAGNYLLGWSEPEIIPGIGLDSVAVKIDNKGVLGPERRMEIVWQDEGNKKFTSSEAWNHLIGLGEFYAMYLFTWSNVLWPEQFPDTTGEIFGKQIFATDEGEAYRRERGMSNGEFREMKDRFFAENGIIASFIRTLPKVRRVLANIPTYMMFDDHEITDDWLLSRQWAVNNVNNPLSRRIMTNGLAAFAIFQAWGNTPERFESGPGLELLNALKSWDGDDLSQLSIVARCVSLEHLAHELGLAPVPSGDRIQFAYTESWTNHRVIVLDTRTCRGFPSDQKYAELISEDSLRLQLTQPLSSGPAKPVTIVVSPAPVLGVRLTEDYLQPVYEAWKDNFAADSEAWKLNNGSFQRFLRALSSASSVVLLSGDVHYGFTLRCAFWRREQGEPAVFVQLTSSPFKNQDWKTKAVHMIGHRVLLVLPGWEDLEDLEYLAWANPDRTLRVMVPNLAPADKPLPPITITEHSALVLRERRQILSASREPDWCYRVKFLKDQRRVGWLTPPAPVTGLPSSTDRTSAGSSYKTVGQFHHWLLTYFDGGTEIVGLNNIGEITFDGDLRRTRLHHRLWWAPPGSSFGLRTQHTVDLFADSGPEWQRPSVPVF